MKTGPKPARARKTPRQKRDQYRRAMMMESLEERRVLAADYTGIEAKLSGILNQFDGAVASAEVLGVSIPIVGSQLATKPSADFLAQFATQLNIELAGAANDAQVVTGIQDALDNLGVVGATVTTAAAGTGQKFSVDFNHQLAGESVTFDTGLAAAFLGASFITANGEINANLRFDFSFDILVSDTAVVSLDTNTDNFQLLVGVDVTTLNAEADLGLLKVKVTDNGTAFSAGFAIDAIDPDGQFASTDTLNVESRFTADVDINLRLRTDLSKYEVAGLTLFPEVVADLSIQWEFASELTGGGPLQGLAQPDVSFDVFIDAGSFFTNFVDPLLKPISQIVEPLLPIVTVFKTAVPGFNDIGPVKDLVDGSGNQDGTANLIDFLYFYNAGLGDGINTLIDVLDKFGKLVELRASVAATGLIPLGSFSITADLRTNVLPETLDLNNPAQVDPNANANPVGTITDGGAQAFFAHAANALTIGDGSFTLDIVQDPLQAFKLLLNQDATLFTWDLPTVSIPEVTFPLFEIPIFPLLSIGGNAKFGMDVDLLFGFDTRGLRQFIGGGSVEDVVFGGIFLPAGDAIVTLNVGIELEGSAGQGLIGSAKAGIDTGADGIKFSLADLSPPNNDGKVYLNDLGIGLANDFLCVFEITGSIVAYLEGELKVGVDFDWVSATKTIAKKRFAEVELVSFTAKCDNGTGGEAALDAFAATIATRLPDGTLRLNMGPFASARGDFNKIDGAEDYEVVHLDGPAGDEKIEVRAFGFTKIYEHINHVFADGGVGNDRVALQGVLSTAAIYGNLGDDELTAGPGSDDPNAVNGSVLLDGGDGNDNLLGGTSADVLRGGSGNDIVNGRGGDDDIDGGSGDDELYGEAGNDFIVAGHGHDIIDGGDNDDHLYGDEGNDEISGGAGNDEVYGGDDDDLLFGNEGNDVIVGGGGSDLIVWTHFVGRTPAEPSIVDGNDIIDGAEGTDRVVVATSSETEVLLVESLGSNVFVRRTTGGDFTLSLIAVELLGINLGAGGDTATVVDTAGTDLEVLQINMGNVDTNPTGYATIEEFLTSATFVPDAQNDTLIVQAGPTNDNLTIAKLFQSGLDYVEINGLAARTQLFDSLAANDSLDVRGGAGDDSIKAFPLVETLVKITLTGDSGDDYLSADAILLGGPGNDTLEGLPNSNDSFNGGAGFDTVLIRGTPGNDTILVDQSAAGTLQVNVNGVTDNETIAEMEAVRIEGEEGADVIGVTVADNLSGSLAFRLYGGAGNDRVIVRDVGVGDLVVHRQGHDGVSGSIIVGALKTVDYENFEFVDITPIDTVTGATGDALNGRLLVIPADPYESNQTRLVATPLGGQPVFIGNLSIEPGAIVLPAPFGTVGGDEDWFEFRAEKVGTFRFEALFERIGTLANGRPGLPGTGDLDIAVYNQAGVLIASSLAVANDASVDISVAAGNRYYARVSGPNGAINVYDLRITEVDLLGPRVTDVFITGQAEFDLFAPKPSLVGPTPALTSLTIEVTDSVLRAPGDLYTALVKAAAENVGHFIVRGDHGGLIAVQSVTVTNVTPVVGQAARATIVLTFAEPLPDDRYTFTISDAITDPAGNSLDGESNASTPQPAVFPSGDGVAGGAFTARFTVDSRPEFGSFAVGAVTVDLNGNFIFDPVGTAQDAANTDVVFQIGTISDAIFAGKFEPANLSNDNDGFDKLGVYGYDSVARQYRFLLDLDHNGVTDLRVVSGFQVNAAPVAGNFNAAHLGDEIGLFDGQRWYLDTNGDNQLQPGVDTVINTAMRGLPLVGDFNRDGFDDLATYDQATNTFTFDTNRDGVADQTLHFASDGGNGPDNGFNDRPFTGDYNLDGVDDLGIWLPNNPGNPSSTTGQWYILVSDATAGPISGTIFQPFSPAPLGNDFFGQFGNNFTLPVFGNFDPPLQSSTPINPLLLQNQVNPGDVDGDGTVAPLDALLIINALNAGVTQPAAGEVLYYDVSGDNALSPLDALLIVNWLNAGGQSEAPVAPSAASSAIDPWAADWFYGDSDTDDESDDVVEDDQYAWLN